MIIREKAVRFGKTASMVGIVGEPEKGVDANDRPAVIFLNSGIVHRVGACRLHTQIARELGESGFLSLRFDLSGIGDSEVRRDSLSFEESSVVETKEAMDYLTSSKGTTLYVLVGLCSGADIAHLTARADDRVVGIVMLDPWAYRDRGFYLRHYGPKILKLSAWKHSIAVRVADARKAMTAGPVAAGAEVTYELPRYVRGLPPREIIRDDLRDFVKRGLNMLMVFTNGQIESYNNQRQYRKAFPEVDFGNLLRVEYLPDATHIFTGLDHQRYLVREVVDWVQKISRQMKFGERQSA